jgi:co-chaperonin GroES (HSP10)
MSKVLVPNHIAEEQETEVKSTEEEKTEITLDNAYVKEEERYLDPTLLDKNLLERMPTPSGWRILVLPYAGKGVSSGGIHLVQETVSRETLATVVAYVLKKGPLCYNNKEKHGDSHWCQEKDWVLIGRYSGARFKLEDGAEVRLINDDEVIATIIDPSDIIAV